MSAAAVGPGHPPLRKKSPAKRAAILAAAMELFLQQGYERTSVDAIAALAGVGKQTVYGHFGDKESLFLAVIAHAREIQETERGAVVLDAGDPLTDLTTAGESILSGVLSPTISGLHRLTIAELPHHPELQKMWRDDTDRPGLDDLVSGYLRSCDESGILRVPDPALTTRQFTYLLITEGRVVTLQGTVPLSPTDRHRIATQTADLIVRACRP
ncbi:TetR/AcrR family transcriptional regulator [Kribbella sp. NPDC026611]|uniref:TetR/AcrR family transcriptional regulator n=1 Tax=Kribbella sp. NPDC026611 TaxID=3154911 RepID=UPI0033DEE2D8